MSTMYDGDLASDQHPGLDLAGFEAWMSRCGETLIHPITVAQATGGRSNLTFVLEDASGSRFVLRRPPLGTLLETAHDVLREHRILSALQPTSVAVPDVVGACDDPSITGAPFFVMAYVEGRVVTTDADATALTRKARGRVGAELAHTLASIHSVPLNSTGLDARARSSSYLQRQLARLHAQWRNSKTRELREIDEVHAALVAKAPTETEICLVHGDFRLGNCIVDGEGDVRAVLDWELAALGDPLADLAFLLVTWTEPDDREILHPDNPTLTPGFLPRSSVLAAYEQASGRSTADIPYYTAFALWRSACIVEGVCTRYMAGQMGPTESDAVERYSRQVERCTAAAVNLLPQL